MQGDEGLKPPPAWTPERFRSTQQTKGAIVNPPHYVVLGGTADMGPLPLGNLGEHAGPVQAPKGAA